MHHSCVAVYTGGEDEGEVQEHGKQRDPDTLLRTNFSLSLLLVLTLHSHAVSTSLWQHRDPFCNGCLQPLNNNTMLAGDDACLVFRPMEYCWSALQPSSLHCQPVDHNHMQPHQFGDSSSSTCATLARRRIVCHLGLQVQNRYIHDSTKASHPGEEAGRSHALIAGASGRVSHDIIPVII
jgi:hypothetical protein